MYLLVVLFPRGTVHQCALVPDHSHGAMFCEHICFPHVFSLKMGKKCVNGNRKCTHALLNLSESKSFRNATFGEATFPVTFGAFLRLTQVKSVTLETLVQTLVTTRKRSCEKVMYLQVSVCHSVLGRMGRVGNIKCITG